MTKKSPVEQDFQELTCDDSQQQSKPFHVVLVDIRVAAKDKEIRCVEMPLETKGLEFVALSY
ncbi:unnamed protein product [Absidia cylindrospora]